jgi:hypothetical protein
MPSDPRPDDFSGRVIFGIAYDLDTATTLHDHTPLGHRVGGVVRTFGMNVGTNFADQRSHVALREDDDSVYVSQRGQNFGALFGGH